jgi:N-methylhydantoinase A
VVLGRLGVERRLGGEIALDRGAAHDAVARLGAQMGLSATAMAQGILRIGAVALAGAIKEVSVMRGIDPRDFALFPFGGAGPMHAAEVAEELGMKRVVVPPLPGNFSALGLLIADVRRDLVRTHVSATAQTSIEDVRAALNELVLGGAAELASAGFAPERRRFAASLDMRYCGQSFELSVPVAVDVANIADIERAFKETYAARYGAQGARPIEIVSYRVAAWGLIAKPQLPPIDPTGRTLKAAASGTRAVSFSGSEMEVRIFLRDHLPSQVVVEGPALIEEEGTTTVVPPGWNAELDPVGCLLLGRS